eukprot:7762336-Pyramimonas_sp.AAC.1
MEVNRCRGLRKGSLEGGFTPTSLKTLGFTLVLLLLLPFLLSGLGGSLLHPSGCLLTEELPRTA